MELKIDTLDLSEQATEDIVKNVSEKIEPIIIAYANKLSTKEYFSIEEACEYLNVSRSTFKKFLGLGLPVFNLDKVTRIKRKDIDLFIDRNKK